MNPNVFLAYMWRGVDRIHFCSGSPPTQAEYAAFLATIKSGEIVLTDIPEDDFSGIVKPCESIFEYSSKQMIRFWMHGSKAFTDSADYCVRSFYLINDTLCDRIRNTAGKYIYVLYDYDEETLEYALLRILKSDTELPNASSVGGSDGTRVMRYQGVEEFLEEIRHTPYELLLSEPTVQGQLSLHTLALHGKLHEAPAAELLEASESLDSQNYWGDTPLHLAARSGRLHRLPRGCLTPARLLKLGEDERYSWGVKEARENPKATVLGQALGAGERGWLLEHIGSIPVSAWKQAEADIEQTVTVCGVLSICLEPRELQEHLLADEALQSVWRQGLEYEALDEACLPAPLRRDPDVRERFFKGWKTYFDTVLAPFSDPSAESFRYVPIPRELPVMLQQESQLLALFKKAWKLVLLARSPDDYTLPELILSDREIWDAPEIRAGVTEQWIRYIRLLEEDWPFNAQGIPETLPELPPLLQSDEALLETWRVFWRNAVGETERQFFVPEQHIFPESLSKDPQFCAILSRVLPKDSAPR